MNIFDRLARALFPDDKTQPKAPVFATPLVVQAQVQDWCAPLGTVMYRVARQRADGSLEGLGVWRASQAEAERDLEALLEKDDDQ
jgi:hypothetical protein